ncbi:YitT family protein [Coriobacteriales bacterium OH1046]|nr:YitT family protein [Coriobacteriales bacterium OH1046]
MPVHTYSGSLSDTEIETGSRLSRRREKPGKLQFFLLLNVGLVLTALGIVLFKEPNHFALGGTSGLAIILSTLNPGLPVGAIMWIVNTALVVLGFIFLDKRSIGWTVFSSFALSAYVSLFEWLVPLAAPLTGDTLLELVFAVMMPSIGSALIFNIGASTGGTDILAMILRRHTSLEIGKALLLCDMGIVGWAAVLYGPRTGLYCILGLIAKALVVDQFIESVNTSKVVTILADYPDPIMDFIVRGLHRTATLRDERGGFSGRRYEVIISVLNRHEAAQLRNFVHATQPGAFMTIVSSSEIIGKGFRSS